MTFTEAIKQLKEEERVIIHDSEFGDELPYELRIVGDNELELSVGLREVALSIALIESDAWKIT